MKITVTQTIPIYGVVGHKQVKIPVFNFTTIDEFYRGFYRDFECVPPYRRGQYSMPTNLVAGYEQWKRDHV